MATVSNWNGSALDEAWSNAANFTNGVPLDGYDVTLLKSAPVGPKTGLTQNTILLNLLHIEEDATYDIGTTSVPLEIAATKVVHQGIGTLHYKSATTVADNTAVFIVKSRNIDDALWLSSDGVSRIAKLAIFDGGVTISSSLPSVFVTDCYLAPSNTRGLAPVLTIEAAATAWCSDVFQSGGVVNDNRGFSVSCNLSNGIYNANEFVAGSQSVRITGGTFNLNSVDTPTQTIRHMAGVLDLTAENAGQVKAVTFYVASPQAVLFYTPSVHTVTNNLAL